MVDSIPDQKKNDRRLLFMGTIVKNAGAAAAESEPGLLSWLGEPGLSDLPNFQVQTYR